MASLTVDIKRFAAKTGLRLDTVVRKLALDAFTGLLFRSPVLSGRFRNSWRLQVARPDLSIEPPVPKVKKVKGTVSTEQQNSLQYKTPVSGADLSKAVRSSRSLKAGGVVYLTNNLPYAKPLEDGSSAQNENKPDGILGDTFKELAAKFAESVRSAEVEQ